MEVASSSSSSTSATAAPPVPAPSSSSQPLASSSSSSSSSLASSSSSNNAANYRPGCKHLRNLAPTDLKTMLKRYALGVRWGKKIRQGLVQSLEPDDEEEAQAVAGADDSFSSSGRRGKKRLLPHPLCSACYATLHKPYLCLSCGYAGCFYTSSPSSPAAISQGCLDRHLASKSSDGHNFALEIHSGLLYCHGCHGAVKDVRFDAIYHRERARVAGVNGTGARPLLVDPAEEEGDDDSLACTRMPQHPTSSRVPRGIHNLGATCFLSVILQSFVHNPVLRNYFLSDRHNADLCGHAAGGQSCVACEMDRLFRDFFSHDALSRTPTQAPSPWTPNSFLYTVWRAQANEGSAELSQAGQQDSHELFISVLNAMHTALTAPGSDPASRKGKVPRWVNENDRVVQQQQQRDGDHHHHHHHGHDVSSEEGFASRLCDCIMHRTFSGILQSDVRCLVCGYRSSTHDPVLDLSVDLKTPAGATTSGNASSSASAMDDTDPLDLLEGPASKKQKKSGAAGAAAAAAGGVNGLKRDRDGSTPAGTTMKKTASKTGNLLPPTGNSPSRKPSPSADDSSTTSSPLPPAQDLLDCLRRYCTSERLPPSSYSCPQCGPVEASKQLSLRRLPPVLCIQLKRFEHHLMGSGWSSKVEARVRFPVRLDVREFVTPSVLESGERGGRGGGKGSKKKGRRRRAGSESEDGDGSDQDSSEDDDEGNRSNDEGGVYDDDPLAIDDFLYTLFCVIVHEGTLNTGHYWCFAKWQENWYRFNDAEAPRKCSVAEVVAQEKAVYQLVYVRRGLECVR